MDKDLSIGLILDFYGALLTDKQAECLDLYYNQDLSLSEIADDLGITRQGVHDNIRRGEKQLLEYEEALNLHKRFSDINDICLLISKRLDFLEKNASSDSKECIDSVRALLQKIKEAV